MGSMPACPPTPNGPERTATTPVASAVRFQPFLVEWLEELKSIGLKSAKLSENTISKTKEFLVFNRFTFRTKHLFLEVDDDLNFLDLTHSFVCFAANLIELKALWLLQ